MSDHVKFYDYYIVEGPEIQALIESFEPISQKRSELIKEAMTLVEAVGWVDSQSFGDKGDKLQSFVWKADHNFPCEITIKRRSYMDKVPVIVARTRRASADSGENPGSRCAQPGGFSSRCTSTDTCRNWLPPPPKITPCNGVISA